MKTSLTVEMVEEFQCPGCVCGCDTQCGHFSLDRSNFGTRCEGHVAGTILSGIGVINLGLPKGFNRVTKPRDLSSESFTNVRLHENPDSYQPNMFNVAVWAYEKDGYLFVRTYSPRIDRTFVDVIKGGKASDLINCVVITDDDLNNMD